MARQPLHQPQFLGGLCMVFKVDGSVVTTDDGVNTGLLIGQHLATIKKGTSGDANLVTITLNRPLGQVPSVFFQEITLDCVAREETAPTNQVIQVRTLELDGTTAENDADFYVFVFGNEGIREGKYI